MRRSYRRLCVLVVLVVCGMLLALPPRRAEACACCATAGDWYLNRQKVSSVELAELDNLRLGPTASLSLSEAGFETVRGINDPSDEPYKLALTRARRNWTLHFTDAGGKSGTLSFSLPTTFTNFGTDLQESPPGSAGPILYKEWRFEGPVTGTGIFKATKRGTKFRLVLQGRGNACPSASDFKNWNLQVYTVDQLFAFYGPTSAT